MAEGHCVEFICEDCKDHVYKYGDDDGVPVCQICRLIRQHPEMPEHFKRTLRGQDE